jgi:hypothetical protein
MKCVCTETHALKVTLHRLRAALLNIASDILVQVTFYTKLSMYEYYTLCCFASLSGKRTLNHLKHQENYLKHKINVNLSAIRSLI